MRAAEIEQAHCVSINIIRNKQFLSNVTEHLKLSNISDKGEAVISHIFRLMLMEAFFNSYCSFLSSFHEGFRVVNLVKDPFLVKPELFCLNWSLFGGNA